MRHRVVVAVWALVAATSLLAGCGGGEAAPTTVTAKCTPPKDAADVSALPSRLDLGSLGTVTRVERGESFVTATATARGDLEDVRERLTRLLEGAGYRIVGSKKKGDVFFERGGKTTGGAKLVKSDCKGRVRVELFVGKADASAS